MQIPLVERAVLALGILLRLYLALVNAEANDDHLSVIRIIADHRRIPGLRDAWEGFQPKLYHVAVAILWDLSPWQSGRVRVRIAQLVGCLAGIATLFIVRRALVRHRISSPVRALALACVALNPTLVGLNAQATNDSFVILFGTLALERGCEFFRTGTRRTFMTMCASVVLAALSKGSGLVIFVAVTATLVHAVIRGRVDPHLSRGQLARLTTIFVAFFLVSIAAFGSYRSNWKDTGNPFAINGPRAPWPDLVQRTYVYRPGATSILDTYFTFRLVDMLEHPWITNDPAVYPLHRTSLWSQLYGRAHVAHFAQHPPSWRSESPLVASVTRMTFLFALLPTALLIAGTGRAVLSLIGRRGHDVSAGEEGANELLALTGLGFFAFIILYTLSYRDFSTMKAEFLFPGLLAYLVFLAIEVEQFMRKPAARQVLRIAFGGLLALYVGDLVILAGQLTAGVYGRLG